MLFLESSITVGMAGGVRPFSIRGRTIRTSAGISHLQLWAVGRTLNTWCCCVYSRVKMFSVFAVNTAFERFQVCLHPFSDPYNKMGSTSVLKRRIFDIFIDMFRFFQGQKLSKPRSQSGDHVGHVFTCSRCRPVHTLSNAAFKSMDIMTALLPHRIRSSTICLMEKSGRNS